MCGQFDFYFVSFYNCVCESKNNMKLSSISLIFIILVGLINGCKKDPAVSFPSVNNSFSNADTDFVFYPTKNAIWIIKSGFYTPDGLVNCLDTFRLGKDTLMLTETYTPNSIYLPDTDSISLKNYKEITVSTMFISSTLDTSYSQTRRYGWFRQDITNRKVLVPYLNTSNGSIYEELGLNFNLEVGDTADFTPNWSYPLIVKSRDSIALGNKYLSHITYGPPSYTQPTGEIIQAVDFVSYNLTNAGNLHPGGREWKKFIYKTDTLLITY